MKKIAFILIFAFTFCSYAYGAPIHKYEEIIPISESITLTKVREFHSDKNISYSYIKADLKDENTSLKLLKSENGADIIDTVSNLAKTDETTVAALNADFFSVHSGNKGFSLGIEIKDGELIQSPINPSTMATISYVDSMLSMSYLDFHIMAVAPNWQYNEIRHLNKHTTYYGDILMYTKEFNGGMSPAPGGEVLEVVVEDGKIVEFRRNMPSVKIPENGCVLVVSEGVNMFFANNFAVGDPIKFDYYITPDISEAEVAFGGGAMLVNEGKAVTTYSHTVAGNNPRSAIGVDKSGSTLYLVAVDGRQDSSLGMRMSHLAELMISLGCHYAVNLDGGGSTNMVASTVWNENIHTVNSPTENRKVINAIGLSYTSEPGKPDGIMIKKDKDVTFIGQSVNISAAAYDKNKRPVSENITLSSEHGEIEDGVFTPEVAGNAVIKATCGNITKTDSIFVMNKIAGIETDSYVRLEKGKTFDLTINAFDSEGHYVNITNLNPFSISSSNEKVASVSGKTIKALSNGTAFITIEKDGVMSYVSVAVGGETKEYTDGFETLSAGYKGYPTYVAGTFELSEEQAYSGKTSGKLTYDFTSEEDENKGAYISLKSKQIIDNSSNTVSLEFFTETDFNHELRAQFIDGNGKLAIASFGKEYESQKWQTLTAKIPDSAVRPVTLDSIYVLCTPENEKDSGTVYIDDLTFDITIPIKFSVAPPNVYSATDKASGKSLMIGAVISGADTLISNYVNNTIENYATYASSYALIGKIDKFSTYEDQNSLFINLVTSKGGIRNTDSSQWDKTVDAINKTKQKNIFILSDNSVFGKDELENKVLCDYLSSLDKNVFVISGGERNSFKNIDGVNYFTLGNKTNTVINNNRLDNYKYLEFYFGSKVTFDWKNYY